MGTWEPEYPDGQVMGWCWDFYISGSVPSFAIGYLCFLVANHAAHLVEATRTSAYQRIRVRDHFDHFRYRSIQDLRFEIYR